jgi:hypothetical protein
VQQSLHDPGGQLIQVGLGFVRAGRGVEQAVEDPPCPPQVDVGADQPGLLQALQEQEARGGDSLLGVGCRAAGRYLGEGEPPGESNAYDVGGRLVQRDERRCGLRTGPVHRILDLPDGGRSQGADERLPRREPAVDSGAGHACLFGDLLHAGCRIGAQHPLGSPKNHLNATFCIGTQGFHISNGTAPSIVASLLMHIVC